MLLGGDSGLYSLLLKSLELALASFTKQVSLLDLELTFWYLSWTSVMSFYHEAEMKVRRPAELGPPAQLPPLQGPLGACWGLEFLTQFSFFHPDSPIQTLHFLLVFNRISCAVSLWLAESHCYFNSLSCSFLSRVNLSRSALLVHSLVPCDQSGGAFLC